MILITRKPIVELFLKLYILDLLLEFVFFNMLTYIVAFKASKIIGGYCNGVHLLPFRTEKLSPLAQMVLPFWWESMSPPSFKPFVCNEGFFLL